MAEPCPFCGETGGGHSAEDADGLLPCRRLQEAVVAFAMQQRQSEEDAIRLAEEPVEGLIGR